MSARTAASIDAGHAELRDIPVSEIDRNPENPRLLFRPGELEQLMESIRSSHRMT